MMIRPFLPVFFLTIYCILRRLTGQLMVGLNETIVRNSLRTDWGFNEPEILWQHEVGLGYSRSAGGLATLKGIRTMKTHLLCKG